MIEELIFSGFGGQGVLTVGILLAYAGMLEGKQVAWIPSYGPETRGGTANCNVVISDETIGSPSIRHPSSCLVMNKPSFYRFEPLVIAGGLLVVNSSLVDDRSERKDIVVIYIPTAELAEKAGSLLVSSMVGLGALNEVRKLVALESVEQALERILPAHRHSYIPMNIKAVEAGAEFVSTAVTR